MSSRAVEAAVSATRSCSGGCQLAKHFGVSAAVVAQLARSGRRGDCGGRKLLAQLTRRGGRKLSEFGVTLFLYSPRVIIKSKPSSALDQINDHDDDGNHEQEMD